MTQGVISGVLAVHRQGPTPSPHWFVGEGREDKAHDIDAEITEVRGRFRRKSTVCDLLNTSIDTAVRR
ncbi:MAG: hypothetical protein ACRDTS_11260 [Mycobacterium sp.]